MRMTCPKSVTVLRRYLRHFMDLISTYLSFILVLLFLVPWVYGKIRIHNSEYIITVVETFVLISATLSLLTFTYIAAMTDIHEKIKRSMVKAGESFFVSTVQFIVGLSLLLIITLLVNHFLDPSDLNLLNPLNFTLTINQNGALTMILMFIQLIATYEIASALSKFLKGILEIYKSFRIKKIKRSKLYKIPNYILHKTNKK